MNEYYTPPPNAPTEAESAAPRWTSLGAQYGLRDMDIFNMAPRPQRSVEQEFRSYIGSPLSELGTDNVKYWEVSSARHEWCTN